MNWKSAWRGGVVAAVVIWIVEMGRLTALNVVFAGFAHANWWNLRSTARALISDSVVLGFGVSWLYVLVRPRLGPGPRTALVVGSLLWVFQDLYLFNPAYVISARHSLRGAFSMAIFAWIKFAAGACAAAWQYRELPPLT